MGLFHLRCQASGLGIVTESVELILVARQGDTWMPIALPIRGEYDTYGSIDSFRFEGPTAHTLAALEASYARAELELAFDDPANRFGAEHSSAGLRGLFEHVRQGMIYEPVREQNASQLVSVRGQALGFVLIYGPLADALVDFSCFETEAGRALDQRLDEADFATRVQAAFGPATLAPDLLEDTPATRIALLELAMIRLWFDPRRSWEPRYECEQYSPSELRALIAEAKHQLAEWPVLERVVDDYEESSLRLADE